ncbi:MAG: hypothetical protein NT030_01840 [Candidatus Saganbacteria bacterium]|nr:hypothetical protein [Candidatus Saganbacteria bacterium]
MIFCKNIIIALALLFLIGSQIASAVTVKPKTYDIGLPKATIKAITEPLDPQKFYVSRSGTLNPSYANENFSCAQMPNGKILAAWETLTSQNKCVGEAVIYSPEMQPLTSVYYTGLKNDFFIEENATIALENNTVLIAYADSKEQKGKYVIINENGRVVKGPVVFNDSRTNFISLTYLSGKKTILLSYQKLFGVTGRGEYVVINEAGDKIWGPVVFNNKGYTPSIGAAITDGLIFLSYNCGFGKTKLLDAFGNVVRDEVQFLVKPLGINQPLTLDNGNIMLLYLNNVAQGSCSILNREGGVLQGPTLFTPDSLSGIHASKLMNGNIFVLYTRNEGDTQKAFCTVLDQNGNRIKELKLYFIL